MATGPLRRAGLASVEGLLLDIDGVLTVSWEPIAGAASAVASVEEAGIAVRYLTNTTTRSRAGVAEALAQAGIPAKLEEIFTAPVATAAYLRRNHPDAACFLLNSGDVSEDFAGVHLVEQGAEVVVVGGAGESFTYERLNRAFGMLLDGAVLVGMHRNLFWRTSAGFELDTGAYLTALEAAARVQAVVLGKPSPDFFAEAVADLNLPWDAVCMVGDDVVNDVLAAEDLGLHAVLVRTGKFRPEALASATRQPQLVIDSIADLPAMLAAARAEAGGVTTPDPSGRGVERR